MNAIELNKLRCGERVDFFNEEYTKFEDVSQFKYAGDTLALVTLDVYYEPAFINVEGNLSIEGIIEPEIYKFGLNERTAYFNQLADPKLETFKYEYVAKFGDFTDKSTGQFYAKAQKQDDTTVYINAFGKEKNIRNLIILDELTKAKMKIKSFIEELEKLEKITEYPFGIYVRADKMFELINKYKK